MSVAGFFMVLSGTDTVSYYKASGGYIKSKNGWKLMNILARFHKEPKPGSLYFYIFISAIFDFQMMEEWNTGRMPTGDWRLF